ncbi:MAG: hypothetical protein RLZZ237_1120 [Pseudomonadota bacterium]|jgi:uncharacterized membrane protein YedE/YeeE
MQIDWQHFTPWSSLAGGLLIGLAAAVLILFNGRIAGISGIVGGLLSPRKGDAGWRIAFLAGLLITPLLYQLRQALPEVHIEAGTPALLIAGLLVGLGVRYGAGCTSGHGVCGLSRLSLRSLLATICFMAAGFFTVYLLRHGLDWT